MDSVSDVVEESENKNISVAEGCEYVLWYFTVRITENNNGIWYNKITLLGFKMKV